MSAQGDTAAGNPGISVPRLRSSGVSPVGAFLFVLTVLEVAIPNTAPTEGVDLSYMRPTYERLFSC